MLLHLADGRAALAMAAIAFCPHNPVLTFGVRTQKAQQKSISLRLFVTRAADPFSPAPRTVTQDAAEVFSAAAAGEWNKPAICTADELHYAPVPGTDWRLALWRYTPPPEAPMRNHPLMLLSGVATNAIGFDLSPGASFARHMSSQGFDTWIVEVRGAGLSMRAESIQSLLESRQGSMVAGQVRDLSQRLITVIQEGQQSVSPQLYNLQERLISTIEDFQKQLDMIIAYDWDFDNYLEEDVPAAMEYIRLQTKTKDGKLLAIGHSMGGILLYAMISKYGDCGLAAVVTLASSVDYTTSKSSLKLLLPLADPAQALNVPAVPLGALLTAAYPLSSRPPYVLSWIKDQISAQDMMHPELFSKLVLNNFCTVPAKVLLQLTTAFREGGLRNRTGTFSFKDHLRKCNVPVLALAGDLDLICPPEAVYETVKLIPKDMVTYKVFGKPGGPHYAHYDLVGGRLAVDEVYPCIIEFLARHDD